MRYPRYYKVCPRGFANEMTYYVVHNDAEAQECEREHDDLPDRRPGAITGWTNDRVAAASGVAVNWADRAWLGNVP